MFGTLQSLSKHLDLILAVLGCIMGAGLVFVYLKASTPLIIYIAVALLIISPFYLCYRKILPVKKSLKETEDTNTYFSRRTYIISDILFWAAIAISYIILFASGETRPLSYFIITAAAAGFIVISLFSREDNLLNSARDIIKILVLGLCVRLSVYVFRSGNGGSGGDFFGHMAVNQVLSDVGNLDYMGLLTRTMNKEISFPLMHIQTAITDILTGLPIKASTFIAVSVPLLISTVCVYLTARELFNNKTAVLATLILSVCDYVILWGFGPVTTSFGLCLFYFGVYCMVKAKKSESKILWTLLLILFTVSVVFTHAVSTFIMLTAFFAFSLGLSFYDVFIKGSKIKISDWVLTIVFGISVAIKWIYSYYSTSTSFLDRMSSTLIRVIDSSLGSFNTVASAVSDAGFYEPLTTLFISNIGYVILFALSILGMYLLFNRKNLFKLGVCVISLYLLLQFVTYIFPIFGLRSIIPDRWFAFIWFFASILMAFAIIYLCNRHGKKIIRLVPVVIIVFTFSMITCPIANDDSPLMSGEYRFSNSYTLKEIAAGQTLGKYISDGQLITDYYFMSRFKFDNLNLETNDLKYDDVLQIKQGFTPSNIVGKLLVYRDESVDRGIRIFMDISQSGNTAIIRIPFGEDFKKQVAKYSKLYDISSVCAYSADNVNFNLNPNTRR